MKSKGLTIPDLEKSSGVSRATISNILNGKADPSFSTLAKIASSLEVSQQELFSEPPVLKSLRYRTNKNMSAREKASRDTLLFTVSDKLRVYNQIEKHLKNRDWLNLSDFPRTPIEAAHELRNRLKISQDAPVYNFCGHLSSFGIKQFYFSFGLSKTFGLSVNKIDGGPAIFVNTGTANVERWIFTMFHEMGHIILHPQSYDGQIVEEDPKSKEEEEANLFASEFLLPADVVHEKVKGTRGFSFIDKLLEIKKAYSVSYQTALKQYCMAYPRDYNEVLPKFQAMCKSWKKHDFKDHYEPNALDRKDFTFEDPAFRNCVYEAVKADDMEIEIASKLVNMDEDQFACSFNEFCDSVDSQSDEVPF